MLLIVLLASCFVSVERAWKAYLLCLAIGIELLLCNRVIEASSSYIHHLGSPPLTVVLEAGLLTAAFLVGRGLRWVFVRERPFPKIISMASEWRESSLIRPLFYLALIALGMTLFAVTCLNTPEDLRWEISYRSIFWTIACLGVLATWVVACRRLVKDRHVIGIGSVLVAILLKGFSLSLLGNQTPLATASPATGVVQLTAANRGSIGPAGAPQEPTWPQGITGANYKGHFSTSGGLQIYDCATLINREWATVGSNYEVWQVDSGTWADQGYNIQGVPGNPGPSGISAITGSSFAIPAVGSTVSIPATMPWVDVGDTICVTDGTHQLKGTVLANTGSRLSVLNCGYAANNTGTVAAGSPISLSAPPSGSSDVIYGCDDFLSFDAPTDGSATWSHAGSSRPSVSNCQNGHTGIVSFPSGAAKGVNELIANQGSAFAAPDFGNVQKCVVRFVVSCDALFSSGSFDGEWYVGIGNPNGSGAMYGGALLNFAPGFPATGLLAGSYTSTSNCTETPTRFTIAPNTWYDLIVSWTPTAIKYYGAVYGETPKLIATNTTNISTIPQFPLAGNNRYRGGTSSVTLFIDKVEWFYQISGNNPVTRRFIQPTNGSSSSFQPKRFSRISLHPPISGFMNRLSFIIRTLCPSTSLVPVSFQV